MTTPNEKIQQFCEAIGWSSFDYQFRVGFMAGMAYMAEQFAAGGAPVREQLEEIAKAIREVRGNHGA